MVVIGDTPYDAEAAGKAGLAPLECSVAASRKPISAPPAASPSIVTRPIF